MNESTFKHKGYHLYYRIMGDENGMPLVLIHGLGVPGVIWQSIVPYLTHTHRLYIIDIPGYGRSRYTGTWQLRTIAPLLEAWLEHMQLPSVALMGQSMGGAVAIHLAALAPARIQQLILLSAAGIPFHAPLPILTLRSVFSFFQPGNGTHSPEAFQSLLRPRFRMLWEIAREMERCDLRAELASITMPTLIIWGERDILIPITFGHQLKAALPHARFVTLPHCGHRTIMADPATVSHHVLEFLSS